MSYDPARDGRSNVDPLRLASVIARYGDLPVARLAKDDVLIVVTPERAEASAIARELAAVGFVDRAIVFSGGVRVVVVSADLLDSAVGSPPQPHDEGDERV